MRKIGQRKCVRAPRSWLLMESSAAATREKKNGGRRSGLSLFASPLPSFALSPLSISPFRAGRGAARGWSTSHPHALRGSRNTRARAHLASRRVCVRAHRERATTNNTHTHAPPAPPARPVENQSETRTSCLHPHPCPPTPARAGPITCSTFGPRGRDPALPAAGPAAAGAAPPVAPVLAATTTTTPARPRTTTTTPPPPPPPRPPPSGPGTCRPWAPACCCPTWRRPLHRPRPTGMTWRRWSWLSPALAPQA